MNEQNLIPQNKRTKAEQREIAKKGGQASGESRRKKKSMRELFIWYLDQKEPGTDKTVKESIAAAWIQMCLGGDIRAINRLLEIIGEAPAKSL